LVKEYFAGARPNPRRGGLASVRDDDEDPERRLDLACGRAVFVFNLDRGPCQPCEPVCRYVRPAERVRSAGGTQEAAGLRAAA
jgi:hypothetical protein